MPPDRAAAPVLFIDRCAWSRSLGEALRQADILFVAHRDRFEPACPDEEWLAVAGREDWIVVTRNRQSGASRTNSKLSGTPG